MKVIETKVTGIIRRTPHVISVRVGLPEEDSFAAGQFLGVTLFNNGVATSRYLSFSNSPTEKGYAEFTKRLTDSDFSRALASLRVGDKVTIKFPLGKFVLDETRKKHAFLAGGIGITPIRSMWQYAFDQRSEMDLVLLYSNRSVEDIIFRDYFESIGAKRRNFRVAFSLDTPGQCPVDWRGHCGYIDADMIRKEVPDYPERVFYICGPTPMVKKMVEILKGELSVDEANIRRENITGY